MSAPIELDLRRDLPKVRKNHDKLISTVGLCNYTTPCAVGVMMTAAQRRLAAIRHNDTRSIQGMISDGVIAVPVEQVADFRSLQQSFDSGLKTKFDAELERLEAKYLLVSA